MAGEGIRTGTGLTSTQRGHLVVALDDPLTRDALLAWLAPGLMPPDLLPRRVTARVREALGGAAPWCVLREPGAAGDAAPGPAAGLRRSDADHVVAARLALADARGRLRTVVTEVGEGQRAGLLALFGGLEWWCGDGPSAHAAAAAALRADPGHRLATLLEESVRRGMRWDRGEAVAG